MYWVDWVLDINPKGAFLNYLIREKHGMGVKQVIIKVTAHEREVDNFIDKQLRGFKPFLNQPYFLFLPSGKVNGGQAVNPQKSLSCNL